MTKRKARYVVNKNMVTVEGHELLRQESYSRPGAKRRDKDYHDRDIHWGWTAHGASHCATLIPAKPDREHDPQEHVLLFIGMRDHGASEDCIVWRGLTCIVDAVQAVDAYYAAARDLGSLDPLDIGYDLRVTGTPVEVPQGKLLRVRMPRSREYPDGRVVQGSPRRVMHHLRESGFQAVPAVGDTWGCGCEVGVVERVDGERVYIRQTGQDGLAPVGEIFSLPIRVL